MYNKQAMRTEEEYYKHIKTQMEFFKGSVDI